MRRSGVRISQGPHFRFAEEVASGLRPSALVSAKKFQGVLNSAKSIPAESRRFEPMETRKSFIPERFSCLERFSAWLASIIQFRMSSSQTRKSFGDERF